MRPNRRTFLTASLFLACAAPACAAEAPPRVSRGRGVTVEKGEAAVKRRTFDPRNPPPEMPPLGPRADAITESRFGCGASVQYTVTSRKRGARGGCTASARIEGIRVTVDLGVTIWVPANARPKLTAHEEGHRVISERVYDEQADAVAREEAQKLVGRTLTASGENCEAAVEAAIKEANQRLCHAYLDATSGWTTRLGNRYDDLTSHGRRANPNVEEAIRLVFEQEPQREKVQPAAKDGP